MNNEDNLRLLKPEDGVESSNLDSNVENVAELLKMKIRMNTAATIVSGSAKFAAKERGLVILCGGRKGNLSSLFLFLFFLSFLLFKEPFFHNLNRRQFARKIHFTKEKREEESVKGKKKKTNSK